MGGVGGVGGGAREQPPTTLPFLPWEVGGGPGRRAGGEGEMGGDQTSVGDEGWVRERGRSGQGGQLSFWGMKGGTRAEGSEVERVDKMWWTPGYA